MTIRCSPKRATRDDLDRVSTRHPIWVVHISGHLAVANSKALEIAGVTRTIQQPHGGRIRLDARTGEPNGVFEEAARSLVSRHLPAYAAEQRQAAIRQAQEGYLAGCHHHGNCRRRCGDAAGPS